MNFTEMMESVSSDINAFENFLNRCEVYNEATYREYDLNLSKNLLKVIKEGSDEDALNKANDDSTKDLGVRNNKIIKKLVSSTSSYTRSVYSKLRSYLNTINYKTVIKKMEDNTNNPKLKSIEFSVLDINGKEKGIFKTQDVIALAVARYKAKGDVNPDVFAKVNKINSEALRIKPEVNKVNIKAVIKAYNDLVSKVLDGNEDSLVSKIEDIASSEIKNPKDDKLYIRLVILYCKSVKEQCKLYLKAVSTLTKAIKKITGTSPANEKEEKTDEVKEETPAKESVDIDATLEDIMFGIDINEKSASEIIDHILTTM